MVVVTARTRCRWVNLRECGELLYGRRFFPRLKGAVYKSYVRPVILYESEMGILRRTERSTERALPGVQLKDRKISTNLMFMLGLNETIDQLAMANSVCWYGHVLRRALDFEVEGQWKKGSTKDEREAKGRKESQRKKWRLKRTWEKQVEEESVKVGLRREDAFCRSKLSVSINQIAAALR